MMTLLRLTMTMWTMTKLKMTLWMIATLTTTSRTIMSWRTTWTMKITTMMRYSPFPFGEYFLNAGVIASQQWLTLVNQKRY